MGHRPFSIDVLEIIPREIVDSIILFVKGLTHSYTHRDIYTPTHRHTSTYTYTLSHTHTHTLSYTHTLTHTQRHTYTYTQGFMLP